MIIFNTKKYPIYTSENTCDEFGSEVIIIPEPLLTSSKQQIRNYVKHSTMTVSKFGEIMECRLTENDPLYPLQKMWKNE